MNLSVEDTGFAVVEGVLDSEHVTELIDYVETELRPLQGRGGVRNLLHSSTMPAVAQSVAVKTLVEQVLGPDCFPVRGILFDKTPDANWKVPWHQDVTIAVHDRIEIPGYGPRSIKQGVTHVQPPAQILEGMITVRLHLDQCPTEKGALRVLPGTHRSGKLGEIAIARLASYLPAIACEVKAGGRFADASTPGTRVVRSEPSRPPARPAFDFAANELHAGLEWDARRSCSSPNWQEYSDYSA